MKVVRTVWGGKTWRLFQRVTLIIISNWQRKQNRIITFLPVVPYELEQQRKESKEFLDDLTTRDQRMMFSSANERHTAENKGAV